MTAKLTQVEIGLTNIFILVGTRNRIINLLNIKTLIYGF